MSAPGWYVCREPTRGTVFVLDVAAFARHGCALPGQRGFDANVIAGPMDKDAAFAECASVIAAEPRSIGAYYTPERVLRVIDPAAGSGAWLGELVENPPRGGGA